MTTTERCPGNELNKTLNVITYKCASCGKENEVFGDELNKEHKCASCGTKLDTSKCAQSGGA